MYENGIVADLDLKDHYNQLRFKSLGYAAIIILLGLHFG